MKTRSFHNQEKDCPSKALILLYSDGFIDEEVRKKVHLHLDSCSSCRADVKSLEYADLDMLVAEHDIRALKAFSPDLSHAKKCQTLTDKRIVELFSSESEPDEDLLDHIVACDYCRCRSTFLEALQCKEPTLGQKIITELMAEPLTAARMKLKAQLCWSPLKELTEKIEFILERTGQIVTKGLEFLVPQPAYGDLAYADVEGQSKQLLTREIPLLDWEVSMKINVLYKDEEWLLQYELDPEDSEFAREAHIKITNDTGEIAVDSDVTSYQRKDIRLSDAEWRITVSYKGEQKAIPLALHTES